MTQSNQKRVLCYGDELVAHGTWLKQVEQLLNYEMINAGQTRRRAEDVDAFINVIQSHEDLHGVVILLGRHDLLQLIYEGGEMDDPERSHESILAIQGISQMVEQCFIEGIKPENVLVIAPPNLVIEDLTRRTIELRLHLIKPQLERFADSLEWGLDLHHIRIASLYGCLEEGQTISGFSPNDVGHEVIAEKMLQIMREAQLPTWYRTNCEETTEEEQRRLLAAKSEYERWASDELMFEYLSVLISNEILLDDYAAAQWYLNEMESRYLHQGSNYTLECLQFRGCLLEAKQEYEAADMVFDQAVQCALSLGENNKASNIYLSIYFNERGGVDNPIQMNIDSRGIQALLKLRRIADHYADPKINFSKSSCYKFIANHLRRHGHAELALEYLLESDAWEEQDNSPVLPEDRPYNMYTGHVLNIAGCLLQLDRNEEALQWFQEIESFCAQGEFQNGEFWYLYAICLERTESKVEAKRCYQRAAIWMSRYLRYESPEDYELILHKLEVL